MDHDNPWGPADSAKELINFPGNRTSYQEPSLSPRDHIDLTDGHEASLWSTSREATYPPPAANPFNASRGSALRTLETPKKSGQVRSSAPVRDRSPPVSSPGLDGPLTYAWQPKGDIVLGVAVVDFNHLVITYAALVPVPQLIGSCYRLDRSWNGVIRHH
jgi:hypothetical protein